MQKLMYTFVAFALAGTLLAADRFSGTWKLDPSQSTGTSLPKEETLVIMDDGKNVQVTITGTDAEGAPISITYVVPTAGGAGQVSQGPYDNISEKRIDEKTREVSYGKGGKHKSHRREIVSKDGKTMTVTTKETDAQGKTVANKEVYTKQ